MSTKSAPPTPTTPVDTALSEMEVAALSFLQRQGGCVLVTAIPDKTEKELFGERTPGMPVYKKLDKRGLVNLTVEDADEDGFQFTPMAELTDLGEAALRAATERCTAAR